MNLDLYTAEFRNFRYLKSDAADVVYFKENTKFVNRIRPLLEVNNPDFAWKTRLEFLEQLFDLRQDAVYYVAPATYFGVSDNYSYEDSRLYEIIKPYIYKGSVIHVEQECALEDIPQIEGSLTGFYLASHEGPFQNRIFLNVEYLPLIRQDYSSYAAMFYSKETATSYQEALTQFLRSDADSIK